MKRRKINIIKSDPKAYISMEVDFGGAGQQSYNVATGETYPLRVTSPIILKPRAGYSLPDTGENSDSANAMLTDGHWYRLDGSNNDGLTATNEITNGMPLASPVGNVTDRFVINTTKGSPDYGKMTVYEDIDPGKRVTYVFVAKIAVGQGRTVTDSFTAENKVISVAPQLIFDNDSTGLYNPWEDPSSFEVTPKVIPSTYPATFRWETQHGGKWGALGSTCYDWALKVAAATGKLTINRSLMQSEIVARCIATVTVDGVQVQLTKPLTHTRRLPWFDYDYTGISNLNADMKTISPMATGKLTKGILNDFTQEVRTEWYGSGSSPVDTGKNPVIPVSSLGTAMELGIKISDRGGFATLLDNDGAYLIDGSDGKQLLVKEND